MSIPLPPLVSQSVSQKQLEIVRNSQNVVRMQLECSQNVIRMQAECKGDWPSKYLPTIQSCSHSPKKIVLPCHPFAKLFLSGYLIVGNFPPYNSVCISKLNLTQHNLRGTLISCYTKFKLHSILQRVGAAYIPCTDACGFCAEEFVPI